jgi:hypothetical protein
MTNILFSTLYPENKTLMLKSVILSYKVLKLNYFAKEILLNQVKPTNVTISYSISSCVLMFFFLCIFQY